MSNANIARAIVEEAIVHDPFSSVLSAEEETAMRGITDTQRVDFLERTLMPAGESLRDVIDEAMRDV